MIKTITEGRYADQVDTNEVPIDFTTLGLLFDSRH
jgi:hypothetical protein